MNNPPYERLDEHSEGDYVLHTILMESARHNVNCGMSGGMSNYTRWVCARNEPDGTRWYWPSENILSSNEYEDLMNQIDAIFEKQTAYSPCCMFWWEKLIGPILIGLLMVLAWFLSGSYVLPFGCLLLLIPLYCCAYHYGKGKKANQEKMLKQLISEWNKKDLKATLVETSSNVWVDDGNGWIHPKIQLKKRISLKIDNHFWEGMYFPSKSSTTNLLATTIVKKTTYKYPNPKLYIIIGVDSTNFPRDGYMV